MFANTRNEEQALVVRMIFLVLNSLPEIYRFRMIFDLGNTPEGMSFYGEKLLFEDEIGAKVLFELKYLEKKQIWVVSRFEVSSVYLTGDLEFDYEKEARRRKTNTSTLRGDEFLAAFNKRVFGTKFSKHTWTISCARDLIALFENYDRIAERLGHRAVFYS